MTFREHLDECLKDPEFAAAYEELRPESEYTNAILDGKIRLDLSQEELARRAGISKRKLTRIEMGQTSPTVETLRKIANALDKQLHIEFK